MVVALSWGAGVARAAEEAGDVSFRNDVMAVFSKAGCNAGACHGNKSGKGGFKLSLRGQDPADDFAAVTRDLSARRTNPLDPDASLLLLKGMAKVPHEGGARFGTDAPEYAMLRSWIEAGTPRDGTAAPVLQKLEVTPSAQVLLEPASEVQIKATAVFSDGSRRDVSRLAVYEQAVDLAKITPGGLLRYSWDRRGVGETAVIVRYLQLQQVVRLTFVPASPGFAAADVAPANYVDEHVFAKLETLRMNPSAGVGDGEYIRRASLDLLGLPPTADAARAFIADADPDKRAKLVGRLLEMPEHAEFWAIKWGDLLRIEERTLDRKGVAAFHGWVKQSIAQNKPIDRFARELVAARGSTYAVPPANYYRALRDPVTRGESTAQVFLGTRLQCAQCHNHPFDRWTQDDYYSWAGVFSRVGYKIIENKRKDDNDGHEFVGEQIVLEKKDGAVTDPRTNRPVKARLLGTAEAMDDEANRLDALAAWMTGAENPLFARVQVNRIWSHLMGRGIVDPVDDFRATNPPSHPALLDALARDFVEKGHDARHVIRLIMASRTYATSSVPNESNGGDEVNYSHATPRRLTAEQLLDAQHQAAGVQSEFAGYPKGTRAAQIAGVQAVRPRDKPTDADRFLLSFGKPARELSCDCERSNETALGQVFQLVSGPGVSKLLADPENRIGKLMGEGKTDEQIVEELYWSALTRAPAADESKAMMAHVAAASDRRGGFEDVLWALFNAKEFVLRR